MPRQRDDSDDRDEARSRSRKKNEHEGSGLIPLKNPAALVGYYLGVFSMLPIASFIVGMLRQEANYGKVLIIIWMFGIILSPAALLLGLFGLRHAKLYPRAKGMGHAITGVVFGGLALVGNLVCTLVLLLNTVGDKK